MVDGYKLLRRNWQGGKREGLPSVSFFFVCLFVLIVFFFFFKRTDCTELPLKNSDEQFEGLWVKNKGKANKGSLVFGVCCKPP